MGKISAEVLNRNPHLRDYISEFRKKTGEAPEFHETLSEEMVKLKYPNIIYPVGDPIFIHVYNLEGLGRNYAAIEPRLTESEKMKIKEIMALILNLAPQEPHYKNKMEQTRAIDKLIKKTTLSGRPGLLDTFKTKRVKVTKDQLERIRYYIKRKLIDNDILEPMIRDPYIEDIHCVGTGQIAIVHKVFGMLITNIHFDSDIELEEFLRRTSEAIGKPVSDSKPIVDAAMADGSRINIIYSDDISKLGSSFTIRKFSEKPPTVVQLVKWNTFSSEIAAYLWLCLEFGMSIFVSGETASGKTTSLNSMLSFISFNKKIYTAEDTPEVIVPQPVWQRLITRESGPEDSQVDLFSLVKSALRSRPDYIVIGEVRGAEGSVAFQAIQTGHAVLSTFHASSIQKMIQRFTGEPILVPIRFMDNMNVALFQEIVYDEGRIIRRCSTIEEVIKYSKEKGGVLTRAVFKWDPITDKHHFTGIFNSHILENKVAPKMGLENTKDIYKEMERRAKIIQRMVDDNLVGYDDVNGIFAEYSEKGYEGIPEKYLVG